MMRKCSHGVRISPGDKAAAYCSFCTPGGPKKTREVILPLNGVGHPQKLRANGKNSGDCCPNCGSEIFMLITKRSHTVECADCGSTYRKRIIREKDK